MRYGQYRHYISTLDTSAFAVIRDMYNKYQDLVCFAYITVIRSCKQHAYMEAYGMRMRVCTAHSRKNLYCSLMNIGSSRKISYDLTAHCPSGPFPASRCISTCILFCFSITIHKHTMINMYCGTQKNRLIEQRRHL